MVGCLFVKKRLIESVLEKRKPLSMPDDGDEKERKASSVALHALSRAPSLSLRPLSLGPFLFSLSPCCLRLKYEKAPSENERSENNHSKQTVGPPLSFFDLHFQTSPPPWPLSPPSPSRRRPSSRRSGPSVSTRTAKNGASCLRARSSTSPSPGERELCFEFEIVVGGA